MTALRRTLAALVVAGVLGLTGCGGPASHNDADVAFATSMLPHHRQAVEMSDVLLGKAGVADDASRLATTIKAEQEPEITQMTGWLQSWGEPVPSAGTGAMGADDGMMSADEMGALAAASGKDVRTLYLRGMIRHHEGAVTMARTEVEQGRSTEAVALASSVVTSQQAEIEQMNQLLAR
jgi:uncharacterized protein (DUF305 family)